MSRRGLALLIAVMTLGLVSALAATAVELALVEHRSGAALLSATQARSAAEAALAEAAQGWGPSARPVGPGSSQLLWSQAFPQGILAELRLFGTDGPYLVAEGFGSKRVAGSQTVAIAHVKGIVRPAANPPDTLERPRRPARWRWRSPP